MTFNEQRSRHQASSLLASEPSPSYRIAASRSKSESSGDAGVTVRLRRAPADAWAAWTCAGGISGGREQRTIEQTDPRGIGPSESKHDDEDGPERRQDRGSSRASWGRSSGKGHQRVGKSLLIRPEGSSGRSGHHGLEDQPDSAQRQVEQVEGCRAGSTETGMWKKLPRRHVQIREQNCYSPRGPALAYPWNELEKRRTSSSAGVNECPSQSTHPYSGASRTRTNEQQGPAATPSRRLLPPDRLSDEGPRPAMDK